MSHSPSERLAVDKATLRAELERRARARQVITYGEAAALVGRSMAGLMPVLAAIGFEEARRGRPDITFLVVRVRTGLPSGYARERAIAEQEAVFAAWADHRCRDPLPEADRVLVPRRRPPLRPGARTSRRPEPVPLRRSLTLAAT